MPLYEYECKECGHRFDHLGRMADPNPPCPRLTGPAATNRSWADFFLRAKRAFARGEQVVYPGTGQMVGPDYEHAIIHLEQPGLESLNALRRHPSHTSIVFDHTPLCTAAK